MEQSVPQTASRQNKRTSAGTSAVSNRTPFFARVHALRAKRTATTSMRPMTIRRNLRRQLNAAQPRRPSALDNQDASTPTPPTTGHGAHHNPLLDNAMFREPDNPGNNPLLDNCLFQQQSPNSPAPSDAAQSPHDMEHSSPASPHSLDYQHSSDREYSPHVTNPVVQLRAEFNMLPGTRWAKDTTCTTPVNVQTAVAAAERMLAQLEMYASQPQHRHDALALQRDLADQITAIWYHAGLVSKNKTALAEARVMEDKLAKYNEQLECEERTARRRLQRLQQGPTPRSHQPPLPRSPSPPAPPPLPLWIRTIPTDAVESTMDQLRNGHVGDIVASRMGITAGLRNHFQAVKHGQPTFQRSAGHSEVATKPSAVTQWATQLRNLTIGGEPTPLDEPQHRAVMQLFSAKHTENGQEIQGTRAADAKLLALFLQDAIEHQVQHQGKPATSCLQALAVLLVIQVQHCRRLEVERRVAQQRLGGSGNPITMTDAPKAAQPQAPASLLPMSAHGIPPRPPPGFEPPLNPPARLSNMFPPGSAPLMPPGIHPTQPYGPSMMEGPPTGFEQLARPLPPPPGFGQYPAYPPGSLARQFPHMTAHHNTSLLPPGFTQTPDLPPGIGVHTAPRQADGLFPETDSMPENWPQYAIARGVQLDTYGNAPKVCNDPKDYRLPKPANLPAEQLDINTDPVLWKQKYWSNTLGSAGIQDSRTDLKARTAWMCSSASLKQVFYARVPACQHLPPDKCEEAVQKILDTQSAEDWFWFVIRRLRPDAVAAREEAAVAYMDTARVASSGSNLQRWHSQFMSMEHAVQNRKKSKDKLISYLAALKPIKELHRTVSERHLPNGSKVSWAIDSSLHPEGNAGDAAWDVRWQLFKEHASHEIRHWIQTHGIDQSADVPVAKRQQNAQYAAGRSSAQRNQADKQQNNNTNRASRPPLTPPSDALIKERLKKGVCIGCGYRHYLSECIKSQQDMPDWKATTLQRMEQERAFKREARANAVTPSQHLPPSSAPTAPGQQQQLAPADTTGQSHNPRAPISTATPNNLGNRHGNEMNAMGRSPGGNGRGHGRGGGRGDGRSGGRGGGRNGDRGGHQGHHPNGTGNV